MSIKTKKAAVIVAITAAVLIVWSLSSCTTVRTAQWDAYQYLKADNSIKCKKTK